MDLNKRNNQIYTYFIQSVDGGPIKIGSSINPNERLKRLQTSHHSELRIIGIIKKNIERELHQRFNVYRLSGEWFNPEEKLINYINSHAEVQKNKINKCKKIKNKETSFLPEKEVDSYFEYVIDLNDEDIDTESIEIEDKLLKLGWFDYKEYDELDESFYEHNDKDDEKRPFEEEYEDRNNDPECELDAVMVLIDHIIDSNLSKNNYFANSKGFFNKILINQDHGFFCISCQSITSDERRQKIVELSNVVTLIDYFDTSWKFLLFFDEFCVDLMAFGFYGKSNPEECFVDQKQILSLLKITI